jgi:hypothetical protein
MMSLKVPAWRLTEANDQKTPGEEEDEEPDQINVRASDTEDEALAKVTLWSSLLKWIYKEVHR